MSPLTLPFWCAIWFRTISVLVSLSLRISWKKLFHKTKRTFYFIIQRKNCQNLIYKGIIQYISWKCLCEHVKSSQWYEFTGSCIVFHLLISVSNMQNHSEYWFHKRKRINLISKISRSDRLCKIFFLSRACLVGIAFVILDCDKPYDSYTGKYSFLFSVILYFRFFFFFKFLLDTCPFVGPLIPLFWTSGDVSSGFQSQSGFCLIHTWQRHTWSMFPEIHLWCDTFASVYCQHSSQSPSPHACFSRGGDRLCTLGIDKIASSGYFLFWLENCYP